MSVDSSGSQLKPPEKTSLGNKIRSIFDHRIRQKPSETFHQLASLEIPSEVPVLPPDVKPNSDEPIFEPSDHYGPIFSSQDQAEIVQLTQEIKFATEAPKTPERTLFPDRPSLDELIAQDPNKKTKVPFITRQKDIHDLKKSGVPDAPQVYDSLIKKGVPRGLILETKGKIVDYGQYGLYMKHYASYEKELQTKEGKQDRKRGIEQFKKTGAISNPENFYDNLRSRGLSRDQIIGVSSLSRMDYSWWRQTPQKLDRLYSLNLSNETESNIDYQYEFVQAVVASSDEDFQKRRQEIKPLFFLKPEDLPKFFSPPINQDSKPFIDWFSQNFLNDNNQSDTFSETIRQNINTVLLSGEWQINSAIENCLKNIVLSDLNKNQAITIPDIFDQDRRSWEATNIQILNQIEDRNQQKFFIKNPNKYTFNKEGIPLIGFYSSFLSSTEFDGESITIPEKTLLLIENNQEKTFYQNVSHLKNPDFQITCLQHASFNYFDSEGKLTPSFFIQHLTSRKNTFVSDTDISNFSEEEKTTIKLIRNIKGVLDSVEYSGVNRSLRFISDLNQYCDSDGQPNVSFFINAFGHISDIKEYQAFFGLLTPDRINSFSDTDKKQWGDIASIVSNVSNPNVIKDIVSMILVENNQESIFNQDHQPTSLFFEKMIRSKNLNIDYLDSVLSLITPEILSIFPQKDQELFGFIIDLEGKNKSEIFNFLFSKREKQDKYLKNKSLTNLFYKDFIQEKPQLCIQSFSKDDWRFAFGNDTVDNLLNSLPTSTDEKRNAFTHNEYDRTSQFFEFLTTNYDSGFKLCSEHFQIATEYIKNFGLAKSALFYRYFQTLYLHETGHIFQLPEEFTQNQILSIEDLKQETTKVKKICFNSESLVNLSQLTPFQIEAISIATGHSVNRFTRIPIEAIIYDFSTSLARGEIKPLPSEFHPEIITANSIKTETDRKISDNPNLTALSREILTAITDGSDISSEKQVLTSVFNQRISQLSAGLADGQSSKQEYLQKQIDALTQEIDSISTSDSIDNLLSKLIPFTIGLGTDQEKYNSILRQLVFKKVFDKHHNSPGWQEKIRNSLITDDTVSAINQMLNLVNNTIKDHVLNFETKNQDNYWDQATFEMVKKYSARFKKNLSFSTFINELNSYQKSFIVSQLGQNQTIQLVPDRGLIGEMSGYMADVCYTRVYPLLKTYPDLTPYKFISNSESENPEFVGSTLVFKVEGAIDQPVFLIRAFNIPNEQAVDIGKFFESFIDHLTPIARNMGIKKIIAAGTSGTISNYSATTNYIISKYVTGKEPVPLKTTFNFNGYDITNECYLVRNLL